MYVCYLGIVIVTLFVPDPSPPGLDPKAKRIPPVTSFFPNRSDSPTHMARHGKFKARTRRAPMGRGK